MANGTSSYREALLESLVDPREAVRYLNAVLKDYPEGFLKALRNVAQARQMSQVAEVAGIQRESLYRALSDGGNPTFETFTSVLAALDLRMTISSEVGASRRSARTRRKGRKER
jgi:probable addiction module antidote protein